MRRGANLVSEKVNLGEAFGSDVLQRVSLVPSCQKRKHKTKE
jgi:hypothetical protein